MSSVKEDQAKVEYLYGPKFKHLGPDLQPKRVKRNALQRFKKGRANFDNVNVSKQTLIERIAENSDILVSTSILERGLIARQILVTDEPIRIIDGQFPRGYILLNPSNISGALTKSGTILPSGLRSVAGDTEALPLGVGNYRKLKLFLNISAITAVPVLTINARSQDPISLNWVETQADLFSGSLSTVGTHYADLGDFGIDNAFAINWTITGGGADITFSVGHVLKDGLTGSSSGVANTIFLGGPDVNTNTGLPLLEGQKEKYWARPNTELYAVSSQSAGITMSVFDLQ